MAERFQDLIAARKAPGEPDAHLAQRIGISRSQWRHIMTGRRKVSRKVAQRVIALWPELEPLYLAEVRRDLHANGTPTASADNEKAERTA